MNTPKDWGQFQWPPLYLHRLSVAGSGESQNDWHGSGFRSQNSVFHISCSQTVRIHTSSSPESNVKRVGESLQ